MAVTLISSIIMTLTRNSEEEIAAINEAIEDRMGPILIVVSGDGVCQEMQRIIDDSNSTFKCRLITSLIPNSSIRW
jgi:hypothetical protein